MLTSTNVVGGFSQGRTFTVLEYQSGGGGWFRVQGRTLAGWVVADPTLTATGTFSLYSQADGVSALYPQSWGFQVETIGALFVPQSGTTDSVVLDTGTSLKSFGAPGLLGYTSTSSAPQVVCGYTGTLAYYAKTASYSGPTPAPIPVPRQPLYAEIRLTIDSTHAMLIGFNYQDSSQLDVYSAALQLAGVPVSALRGTREGDADRLRERCVPVFWLTPGTELLLTIVVLAIDMPAAATSRIPT